MLTDPQFNHVAMNLVWDEVAKIVDSDAAFTKAWAKLIMKHPTRLRFAIPRIRAWEHENRNRYPAWLVSDRRFPN